MTLCFEVFLVWLLLSRVRRLEFYWHPLWKKYSTLSKKDGSSAVGMYASLSGILCPVNSDDDLLAATIEAAGATVSRPSAPVAVDTARATAVPNRNILERTINKILKVVQVKY